MHPRASFLFNLTHIAPSTICLFFCIPASLPAPVPVLRTADTTRVRRRVYRDCGPSDCGPPQSWCARVELGRCNEQELDDRSAAPDRAWAYRTRGGACDPPAAARRRPMSGRVQRCRERVPGTKASSMILNTGRQVNTRRNVHFLLMSFHRHVLNQTKTKLSTLRQSYASGSIIQFQRTRCQGVYKSVHPR